MHKISSYMKSNGGYKNRYQFTVLEVIEIFCRHGFQLRWWPIGWITYIFCGWLQEEIILLKVIIIIIFYTFPLIIWSLCDVPNSLAQNFYNFSTKLYESFKLLRNYGGLKYISKFRLKNLNTAFRNTYKIEDRLYSDFYSYNSGMLLE